MFRLISILAAIQAVTLAPLPSAAQGLSQDPASELWENAYGWLHTGRNLEEAGQWALAQGTYIEALRKLEHVSTQFPDFETEIVNYRIETLSETMSSIEEKLDSSDHDITMKYLDFIESLETGLAQRYSRNYKEALETLEFAKELLEEVIDTDPDRIRPAVDSQYVRLEESITWLGEFLNLKRRSVRRTTITDTVDWGTTRYIKKEDLPQEEFGELSSGLFPRVPASAAEVGGEIGSGEQNKTGDALKFEPSGTDAP